MENQIKDRIQSHVKHLYREQLKNIESDKEKIEQIINRCNVLFNVIQYLEFTITESSLNKIELKYLNQKKNKDEYICMTFVIDTNGVKISLHNTIKFCVIETQTIYFSTSIIPQEAFDLVKQFNEA
jgi:hypothetical protein